MQGNKPKTEHRAFTGCPIPEFYGWTLYGYWYNGNLLRRKPTLVNWANWELPITFKTPSRTRHKAPQSTQTPDKLSDYQKKSLSFWMEYQIPTLDTAGL